MKFSREGQPIGVQCHRYKFYYPGTQQEGIRMRIRQGAGGPTKIEPGAEVSGHAHIPRGQNPQDITVLLAKDLSSDTKRKKSHRVKLTYVTGYPEAKYNQDMIEQTDRKFIGVEYQGVVEGKLTSKK